MAELHITIPPLEAIEGHIPVEEEPSVILIRLGRCWLKRCQSLVFPGKQFCSDSHRYEHHNLARKLAAPKAKKT